MLINKSILRSTCPCRAHGATHKSNPSIVVPLLAFAKCCAPYLMGETRAPDALCLMRSRYCAYALANEDYLLETWHPDKRPSSREPLISPSIKWVGLDVLSHQVFSPTHAQVEFIAKYKDGGRAQFMKELSNFTKIDSKWYYVDGQTLSES